MLKCKNKEEQSKVIAKVKTFLKGKEKGGSNEFNIRYTDVEIEGLDELVEVDVSSETKKLSKEYTSDMAVRDRLDIIKRKYGEEGLETVVDNIIVAKKILKENRIYKKSNSVGGTEFGGFGGIGVENWILQNGGSFVRAMQTFLENTVDESGKEISFEEFKEKYPIYDFGQNHRDISDRSHDHYIEGLTLEGFDRLKQVCKEQIILLEEKIEEKDEFKDSIIEFTKNVNDYKFSDITQIYGLLARFRTYELSKENDDRGVEE